LAKSIDLGDLKGVQRGFNDNLMEFRGRPKSLIRIIPIKLGKLQKIPKTGLKTPYFWRDLTVSLGRLEQIRVFFKY